MEDVSFKGTKIGDRKVESRLYSNEDPLLEEVHKAHFRYFQTFIHKDSALVFDRSTPTSPISIAATGFGLSAYVVALYRSWISEEEAYEFFARALGTLERIKGEASYKGWWAHFLDPDSLQPARSPKFWDSEFSTIDTTLLMWGVISVHSVLGQKMSEGEHLRTICGELISAIEWREVLLNGFFSHGIDAKGVLIPHVYRGYSEALLLYLLALGISPVGDLEEGLWEKYLEEFSTYGAGDREFVTMSGTPLFCYQYPHCWLDFRGIFDHVGRLVGFDYFENSRRLVLAQIQYAVDNPKKFEGYSAQRWGFSACDGPGWITQIDDRGFERAFLGYNERGAPQGLDDGTICPAAQLAALPFIPELVWEGVKVHVNDSIKVYGREGFTGGYNLTFRDENRKPWVDKEMVGIDHGAAILMVENYRSGLLWSLCMKYQGTVRGMERAGFR
jgi:hypothetical protein